MSNWNPPDKTRWHVLVFPAGTENAIEIWQGLRLCKEVRLTGASSPGSHHGPFVFHDHASVPRIDEAGWVEALNKIIRESGVDFVFPANDLVIDALNEARDRIAAPVILPPPETVRLARSKSATMRALGGSLPVPRTYASAGEVPVYPVFVKPDAMYGAQGAEVVRTRAELDEHLARNPALLVQEFLPGQETTVDCFTDRHGKVRFVGARERTRVRMGTSMNAHLLPEEDQVAMRGWAQEISLRLRMRGPWFFQMKRDALGQWRFLETGIRIAGTMALNRVRGVNFPLLALWDAAGFDVEIDVQPYSVEIDRCLRNRYRHDVVFDTVYVDLDDTLVVHGRLNVELVRFLYQCVNDAKRIVLITKSLHPALPEYLRRWRISELFDEVIHLREHESKAGKVAAGAAIFIDDSYTTRHEVAEHCRIPVFDTHMIEMLIDDRI